MLNQLLKNRIICRIIDLSCRIISLENAAEFPIFCRTLSEALMRVEIDVSELLITLIIRQVKELEKVFVITGARL